MKPLLRWGGLLVLGWIALEVFFMLRIASMARIDPESTTFERSEIWRLAHEHGTDLRWRQQWVPYGQISDHLKRAVIASEDDSFAWHDGFDWDAMEKAWQRNQAAETRAAQVPPRPGKGTKPPKIVGGSTITQQLAKNLSINSN